MELNEYYSIATSQCAVPFSIQTLETYHYTWRCGVQRALCPGVQWNAEVRDFCQQVNNEISKDNEYYILKYPSCSQFLKLVPITRCK